MKFMIGKKLRMSNIFTEKGAVPVTLVEAAPMTVVQVKNNESDGYQAVQFAYGSRKKVNKPMTGHIKKSGVALSPRGLKEMRIKTEFKMGEKELKLGEQVDVSIFQIGDKVSIRGISKSKGFQGSVKRHGFRGSPASHGHKHVLRSPGSIGQRFPQHTLKGTRMSGRMGGAAVSVRGLEIINVDIEKNILLIKGALPGPNGGMLEIYSN